MLSRTAAAAVATLLSLGTALAGGDSLTWIRWDDARPQSAGSGKPILVYSTVDEKGTGC